MTSRTEDRQARIDADLIAFCTYMANESGRATPSARAENNLWTGLAQHIATTDAAGALLATRKPRPTTSTLERIGRGEALVRELLAAEVTALRAEGLSWNRIGTSVGLTGEGARKRWGPK